MVAYSLDLRTRVLKDSDAGMASKLVAETYAVSRAWVDRLKQRRRETGEIAPGVFAYLKAQRLLLNPGSYLVENGLLHTYAAGYRCRRDGSPIPWMNYNVIAFLEQRLKPDMALRIR